MGRDGYTGLAVLAASLALFWATLGLEPHPMVPVGPGFYPRIVLGATAALALLLVVGDLIARPRAAAAKAPPNYRLVVLAFAIVAAYVIALPWIGFRVATLVFLVAMQAALEPPRNARRWLLVCVVGLVTTGAIYFAFERYLHVLLPRGHWTGF